MDGKQFDALTRDLANGVSRRNFLRGLAGAGITGFASGLGKLATASGQGKKKGDSACLALPDQLCDTPLVGVLPGACIIPTQVGGTTDNICSSLGEDIDKRFQNIFTDDCVLHDCCWARCGADKGNCDDEFLYRMRQTCDREFPIHKPGKYLQRGACYAAAETMYLGVASTPGFAAFTDMQTRFCGCCDTDCIRNGGTPCGGACVTCESGLLDDATCQCIDLATCSSSETLCDDTCVDTSTDPNNCQECGNVCSDGEDCVGGVCTPAGCDSGLTECNGTCVDLGSDATDCGECGNVCSEGETCSAGACTSATTGSLRVNSWDAVTGNPLGRVHYRLYRASDMQRMAEYYDGGFDEYSQSYPELILDGSADGTLLVENLLPDTYLLQVARIWWSSFVDTQLYHEFQIAEGETSELNLGFPSPSGNIQITVVFASGRDYAPGEGAPISVVPLGDTWSEIPGGINSAATLTSADVAVMGIGPDWIGYTYNLGQGSYEVRAGYYNNGTTVELEPAVVAVELGQTSNVTLVIPDVCVPGGTCTTTEECCTDQGEVCSNGVCAVTSTGTLVIYTNDAEGNRYLDHGVEYDIYDENGSMVTSIWMGTASFNPSPYTTDVLAPGNYTAVVLGGVTPFPILEERSFSIQGGESTVLEFRIADICGAELQLCGGECLEICAEESAPSIVEQEDTCSEGLRACAETCVDAMTDVGNCGDCGLACGPDQYCESGICLSLQPADIQLEEPIEPSVDEMPPT